TRRKSGYSTIWQTCCGSPLLRARPSPALYGLNENFPCSRAGQGNEEEELGDGGMEEWRAAVPRSRGTQRNPQRWTPTFSRPNRVHIDQHGAERPDALQVLIKAPMVLPDFGRLQSPAKATRQISRSLHILRTSAPRVAGPTSYRESF